MTSPASRARSRHLLSPGALGTVDDRASHRQRVCALSAVAGLALTTLTFYPGQMSDDSVAQLQEARNLVFYNWHPPLMSWTWSILDRATPGPVGMLLLHNLMFWTSLGMIAYLTRLSPVLSPLFILIVGLLPPVYSGLGTISKDVGMASALLLTYSLLLYSHKRLSSWALVVGLLSLFYGFSLRHNAAPAALPLALWAGFIARRAWFPVKSHPILLSSLLGMGIFVSLGLLVLVVEHVLVGGRQLYPIQQILLHDLTAVSVKSNRIHVPESLGSQGGPVTVDKLACIYTPDTTSALFNGKYDQCPFRFKKVVEEWRVSHLREAWWKAVTEEPHAYIEHRLTVFREQFGIGRRRVCYPLQVGIVSNSLGIEFHESVLYRSVLKVLTFAAYSTPLFRGWVYLCVVGIVLLGAVRLRRGDPVPGLVLASSGLLYGLAYLGVATACDFRLHWWSVVAAVVVPVVAWGEDRVVDAERGGRERGCDRRGQA